MIIFLILILVLIFFIPVQQNTQGILISILALLLILKLLGKI